MKRIVVLLLVLFGIAGCNLTSTPRSKVEKYLNSFINLNEEVIMDIETTASSENLSSENKELYKTVLKRQYENMKYEIKDESIDGNTAIVTVKVNVYDLYNAEKESLNYMNENVTSFYDINNMFDNNLYNTYRLNRLSNESNRIDYEIQFYLDKKDSEWILRNPNREVLEKLNGLYKYD